MKYQELLKRAVPFAAALMIGLFIASFFVTVSMPKFKRDDRKHRYHKMQQLKIENESLREQNRVLETRLKELETQASKEEVEVFGVPVIPAAPEVITPYQGIKRRPLNEQERMLMERVERETR